MGPIKSSNLSPSGETEGANITTMKRYIKPTSEIIEIKTETIFLINSIEKTEEEKGGDEALSGGHRGDWENIWGNM